MMKKASYKIYIVGLDFSEKSVASTSATLEAHKRLASINGKCASNQIEHKLQLVA